MALVVDKLAVVGDSVVTVDCVVGFLVVAFNVVFLVVPVDTTVSVMLI